MFRPSQGPGTFFLNLDNLMVTCGLCKLNLLFIDVLLRGSFEVVDGVEEALVQQGDKFFILMVSWRGAPDEFEGGMIMEG